MVRHRFLNPTPLSPSPHRTNTNQRYDRRWRPFSGSSPISLLLLLLLVGPGLAYDYQSSSPPRLYNDLPARISYYMDEGLTLTCSVLADERPVLTAGAMRGGGPAEKTAARSAIIISWYKVLDKKRSRELGSKDENLFAMHNNGRQLQILPISSQQQPEGILKQIKGSYYCQAKNGQFLTRSRKCVVNPVNTPKISLSSDSSSIYAGGTAVLSCKIQPEYAHSFYRLVKWLIVDETGKKQIMNITESNEKYSIVRSIYPFELHIRGVNEKDAARRYKCIVESKIRHRDRTPDTHDSPEMSVKVNTAGGYLQTYMQISHRHAVIKALKGTSVELPCVFHGSAVKVYYVWFRGKQKIYPLNAKSQKVWGKKYQIVAKGHGNLRITNLEASDSGTYECEGLLNEASSGGSAQTRGKIRLNVSAPLGVTVQPRELHVDYKHKAVIKCQVHGYPFSRVFWLHDGRRLTPSGNVAIINAKTSSQVEIKAVDRHSEGVYQCFSESGSVIEPQDNAQGRTELVPLKVPPELVAQFPAPSSKDGFAHLRLTPEKRQMRLRCDFVGSPPQRITWYLDDTRIPLDSDVINLSDYQFKELTVNLEKAFKENGNPQDGVKYGGEYKAVATSAYGQAECRTFVEIDTNLMIREFSKRAKPIEGRDFELKCYVLGRNSVSGVTIDWTKEYRDKHNMLRELSLPLNHRHALKERGRTLVIKNVKKEEDDGNYKCTATDKEGHKAQRTVTLDVMRLPVINKFVDKYHLDEGQDKVTVTCNIKNQADEPWYAWWIFENAAGKHVVLQNDRPVVAGVRITYAQPSKSNFPRLSKVPYFVKANTWVMLEIERPVRTLHAGNYTCVIQNTVGKSNQTAQVSFKPKIKFDVRPPQTKTVVLNNDLVIRCSAKGDKPKPIVEWKFFDKSHPDSYASIRILERKTKGRISQDVHGTLRVVNVTKTDPTQFMCFVSLNASDAEAISQVVKINVQYPAEILPMSDQECKEGARLNLSCIIEGDEPISAKWLRQDKHTDKWEEIRPCNWPGCMTRYGPQSIMTEERKLADKRGRVHVLRFQRVESQHQTSYMCEAKNDFNVRKAFRVIKVTVISAPGRPVDVKVAKIDSRSVQLQWTKPSKDGNKPIKLYVVSVYHLITSLSKPLEPVMKLNVTVHDKEQYSYDIKNLRPATDYRFEVVAVNDVGVSQVATDNQRTTEAKPEAPVQSLSANGTGSDTIRISWKPPPDDKMNGFLTEYRVCLRQAGPGSTDMEKVPVTEEFWSRQHHCVKVPATADKETNGGFKIFSGLPKFTKYYIRVVAVNSIGASPPAYTFARTLEDVPRRPPIGVTCTPGKGIVRLQWNPPNQDDMNGILTGYTIRYFESNEYDDESTAKVINISSSTGAAVQHLQHYTNYTFKIYAVNSKGSGPPSDPARCETRPSEPMPPAQVKFLPVNSTCLVASWRHPMYTNGRLTNYIIYFGTWRDFPDVAITSVDARSAPKGIYVVKANESLFYNHKVFCDLIEGTEYQVTIRASNHAPYYSGKTPIETATPQRTAPARFIGFNRTVVINNNMNLDLSCEAVGASPVEVSLSPQATFNVDLQSLLRNSYIRLKNVQPSHSGLYACRAHNTYSEDEIKYKVDVQVIKSTPPVAPKLIHGRQRLHSVEVEWRPLGSALTRRKDTPIKKYWLTYRNHYTNKETTVEVSANNRTFFLANLTCGTMIEFDIKAENKIGNSSKSNTVKMRTRGSIPIVHDNSNITPKEKDTIYMNLTALFRPGKGCPPLKYRILINPKERPLSDPTYRRELYVDYEDLQKGCCINITGLNRGSTFRYVVEAINAAGSENSTGTFVTPSKTSGVPRVRVRNPKGQLTFWQRPAMVVIMVLTVIVIVIVVMALILFLKRRQTAEELREQAKGPVKKCVNDLKEGKVTEGLPPFRQPPLSMPSSHVPAHDDGQVSDDGSVDSDGNINPYATFTSYETTTIDRHEIPDGGPRELGDVARSAGRMRQRIHKRKRAPYYEPQGPKQYENDSVSGTIAATKRRSNSLDRLDELDSASAATYNQGYATGGGGQMGRSFHEPKYPGDHLSAHYRGGSVLSSTTMSSNHDELSQAYEYGRRARYESALNTTDGFNAEENLDLHTGSGSSETTDPGIRQFTQQPPMPDEQRQATCEVPLFNKTPTTDRRRPSYNASETYEPMDESYYRRNHPPRPLQHPSRQVPLPEPPNLSSTLGRPRVGATAASTRAGLVAGAYRSRADSESIYAGHVYDSTENTYYSGTNYGRRGPVPGPSGVEFPRQPARVAGGRYYNGGSGTGGAAAAGASERHPLVPGGPGSGAAGSVVRPMPYGARGGDPDEVKSLLVGRRYSVQRAGPGSAGSSSSGGTVAAAAAVGAAAAALPAGARRSSRPNAAPGDPAAPGLLIPVPGDEDDDSETENIYTREFTVV